MLIAIHVLYTLNTLAFVVGNNFWEGSVLIYGMKLISSNFSKVNSMLVLIAHLNMRTHTHTRAHKYTQNARRRSNEKFMGFYVNFQSLQRHFAKSLVNVTLKSSYIKPTERTILLSVFLLLYSHAFVYKIFRRQYTTQLIRYNSISVYLCEDLHYKP